MKIHLSPCLRRKHFIILVVVSLVSSIDAAGFAQTQTQTHTAIESRTIRDVDDNGMPDHIQTAASHLEVDERPSDARRIVVEFNVPASSGLIKSAEIKLYQNGWPNDDLTWYVAADNDGVININDWFDAGWISNGTFSRSPSGVDEIDVTSALQTLIAQNNSFFRIGLKMTNPSIGHALFHSRDSGDPPELVVVFENRILYTVTDMNELAAVDIDNGCSATIIGVTQDVGGLIRRIRGLAYDHNAHIMYGMTREGDLVTIDRTTAVTAPVSVAPPLVGSFWGGLAFDDASGLLYTADAFADQVLVEINPSQMNSTIKGSTSFQILGQDFYPSSAPASPPTYNGLHPAPGVLYGSNRSNDNIVVLDRTNGAVSFDMGTHSVGVNNLQAIAFHPLTGILYAIHDHFSLGQNAALSTYDFTAETATELCELPFGIVESLGGGNDTYGWGGLVFMPPPLLVDGFESGDLSAWSAVNGN